MKDWANFHETLPFGHFHICQDLRENTGYSYHLQVLRIERATITYGLDCRKTESLCCYAPGPQSYRLGCNVPPVPHSRTPWLL